MTREDLIAALESPDDKTPEDVIADAIHPPVNPAWVVDRVTKALTAAGYEIVPKREQDDRDTEIAALKDKLARREVEVRSERRASKEMAEHLVAVLAERDAIRAKTIEEDAAALDFVGFKSAAFFLRSMPKPSEPAQGTEAE